MRDLFSFQSLIVWQQARSLVKQTYLLMRKFPAEEKFAMCDQLRRAVTSIPTNLAEGTSRESLKEKVRFVEISYCSLCEVYNLLILALDLGYIGEQELNHMEDEIESTAKMLSKLRCDYSSRISN
mgnify:CR=1 FL=1